MNFVKNMSLVALGVGATLAYQKYSKPMMIKMEHAMNKMARCSEEKLEDMI